MPGKNAHSVNFIDAHETLIDKLISDTGKSRSEVVRLLIDAAIDGHPYIGIPFIEAQKQGLEAQLTSCEGRLSALHSKALESPGISPFTPIAERRAAAATVQPGFGPSLKEGEDLFIHWTTRLGWDGRLGDVARKKVAEMLKDRPEWLDLVPTEYQPDFTGNNGVDE